MKTGLDAPQVAPADIKSDRFRMVSAPVDFGGGLRVGDTVDQHTSRAFALWFLPPGFAVGSGDVDSVESRIAESIGISDRQFLKTYGMHFGAATPAVRMEMSREPRLSDPGPVQSLQTAQPGSTVGWLHQLANGLDALAANHRLVHGAVTPFWIRLSLDGTPRLDGIAFAAAFAGAGVLRAGDQWFSSPARRRNDPLDAADDVFGIAALAFWALTGGGPVEGLTAEGIQVGTIESMRRSRGLAPTGWAQGWDQPIVAGLSPTPSLRPATPSALTGQLNALVPDSSVRDTNRPASKTPATRRAPPWRYPEHREGAHGNGAGTKNGSDALVDRVGYLQRMEAEMAAARHAIEEAKRENALQRARLQTDLAAVAGAATGVESTQKEFDSAKRDLTEKLRALEERERNLVLREQSTEAKANSIEGREASVAQRETWVESKNREIESVQQQMQQKAAELDRSVQESTKAEHRLKSRSEELDSLEKESSTRRAQIAVELETVQREREHLKLEAANLKAEQERVRLLDLEVAQSKASFAAREEEIAAREHEVTRNEAEFAAVRDRLAMERADINRLLQENKSIVDEAKSAESQIAAARLERSRIDEELAGRRAELVAFETTIKERDGLQRERESVLARGEEAVARREGMFAALGIGLQTGAEPVDTDKLVVELIARQRSADEREKALVSTDDQLKRSTAALAEKTTANVREQAAVAETQQRIERERSAAAEQSERHARERQAWEAEKREEQNTLSARAAEAEAVREKLILRAAVQNVLAETAEPTTSLPSPMPAKRRASPVWLGLGLAGVAASCILGFLLFRAGDDNAALRRIAEAAARKTTLVVVTDPVGAMVTVGDRPPQPGPAKFDNLPAGTVKIVAKRDGYREEERSIRIEEGETRVTDPIVLGPPAVAGLGNGALLVQTTPPGAEVKLVERPSEPAQVSPALFKNLAAGKVRFSVRLSEYEFEEVVADVTANQLVTKQHPMRRPAPRPVVGGISVRTIPDDAVVEIDGQVAQRDRDRLAVLGNLRPGPVKVVVRRTDYESREQTFNITAGDTFRTPVIELKRVPPPKVELPKVELPKVEPAKAEPPKVEPPKVIALDLPEQLTLQTVPIRLVRIDPRTFSVRTNEGETIELKITRPFLIGTTEVTQQQYEAVMRLNPSITKKVVTTFRPPSTPYQVSPPTSKEEPLPNNPVENVSWADAGAFCVELTGKEKAKNNLPGSGRAVFRLPTEAEWWAVATSSSAALSTSANDGLEWFLEKGKDHRPVTLQSRDNRVYDLFGNVAEWCFDAWSDNLPKSGVIDPITVEQSFALLLATDSAYSIRRIGNAAGRHVVNGGSFRDPAGRFHRKAGIAPAGTIGFRIVLGYPAATETRN